MQSEEFLRFFPGNQIFVTINDKEKNSIPWHFYGTLEENKQQLIDSNNKDRGVFFTVNELDQEKDPSHKRTKKMFSRARAIFIDDDNPRSSPRKNFPLTPNIIVQSSLQKYHYYWLTSTENSQEWEQVMARLVQDYGADTGAKDLVRVMRLPGFYHCKTDQPFLTNFTVLREQPYTWDAIVVAFPPLKSNERILNDENQNCVSLTTIPQIAESYKQGHRHTPSRALAMKLANQGTPFDDAMNLMFALLPEEHHEGGHRQNLESAYERINSEEEIVDVSDIKIEEYEEKECEWPPGLFGDLVKEIYEMSHYPNRKISIVTALGLVAGIVGRKYNVSGVGLNLYIALLMESGYGKNVINSVIKKCLLKTYVNKNKEFASGRSFLGYPRYTGPKALFSDLEKGLSKIALFEEAGYLLNSKSGDVSGIKRTILRMYTNSGLSEFTQGEIYSDKDKSLPTLQSPALSIVMESTPKVFIDEMKNSENDINGMLARMLLIRVCGDRPRRNRDPRKEFSKKIEERILKLISLCSQIQQLPSIKESQVINIETPDWTLDEDDKINDELNEAKKDNQELKHMMLTRAWLKTIKIAAVVGVFNGNKELNKETYYWAKTNLVEPEIKSAEHAFREFESDDILEIIQNIVGPRIVKALNDEYKDKQKVPNKLLLKRGILTRNNLMKLLMYNKTIKELSTKGNSAYAVHGVDKVIDYMVKNGMMIKKNISEMKSISRNMRIREGYMVTDEFKLLMDMKR